MKYPRTLTALAASLAATGFAPAARAQTTAPATDQVITLPAFGVSTTQSNPYLAVDTSSAARIRTTIADTAGSISVLTPQFLQDIEPSRLYNAATYVAGISEGRGDGFADRMMIRGFENTNKTVDNFSSIQGENADPLLIDRVEVIKGPSAIIAPTGAPGGVLSIVSKAPLYKTQNSVTLDVGQIDAQRLDIDMTGAFSPNSPFAYRFLAGYQDGQLASTGTKDKKKVIGGSVSYQLSPTTKLTLRGSFEDRWVFVYLPVFIASTAVNGADATLAPGFQYGNNLNGTETWAHRGGQYSTADMLLTTSYGDHLSSRLAGKAQYNLQRDEYMAATTPSLSNRYNPYTGQETPDQTWAFNSATGTYVSTASPLFDITNIQRTPYLPTGHSVDFAAQYDLAAAYKFDGVSSTTVAGLAADHSYSIAQQLIGPNLPFNLMNPVYGAQPVFTTLSTKSAGHGTSLQTYVNEQLSFWDDRILLTAGAVRVAATSYSINLISNVATTLDDSKNLGLFGVVIKPIKNVSVYLSRSVNAVPTIANNLPLWQQGQQWEYGVKSSFFNERLSFTAAHFQIAQTNVTVPNPAYQADPTQPQSLISDITDRGYEFELVGGLTQNLSIASSLTNLHERDSLGRPVRAVAGLNSALLLTYRFTREDLRGLSVFVGTTYTGRRSGEAPAAAYTALRVVEQPSFFLAPVQLFSLGSRYSFGKWTVALNVDNVLDKRYIEIPTARTNAGLGLPRNIRVTTTYRF